MAASTTTTETADRVVTTIKAVAYTMFATGVTLSVTHIVDFFHSTLGAAMLTACAMPLFIDGFQIVGRLLRLDRFSDETNAVGWKLQLLGAAASLAANIIAGHTRGDKIAGAILVIGYITIEAVADRIKARKATVAAVAAQALAAKRSAAAQKAVATRAANKAVAAAKKPTPRKAVGTRKPKAITAAPKLPAAVVIGHEPSYI